MILLRAVGDVYLQRENPGSAFAHVREFIREADIRFCSLEAPLTRRKQPVLGRSVALRSDPEMIEGIVDAGFNVVSFAHNHAVDFGYESLLESLSILATAGIPFAGAGRNLDEARAPVLVTVDGVRVALLAYCSILVPGSVATSDSPGVSALRARTFYEPRNDIAVEHPGWPPRVLTKAYEEDVEEMRRDVERARSLADVVVASFHWGLFGQTQVLDYQREAAHAAIEAGSGLVLGHHAHVVQAVEVYRGKVICYGLGNFVFDHSHESFGRETFVLSVGIGVGGVETVSIHPALISPQGQPELVKGPQAEDVGRLIRSLSLPFGTELIVQADETVVRLA